MKVLNDMAIKEKAFEAALKGADYLVRNQVINAQDANCGRYMCQYDYVNNKTISMTTNWTTGVCLECMIIAHNITSNDKYLDSAKLAAGYLASLQYFAPFNEAMYGLFREETPQSTWAHPRDALTAAWALMDWSQYSKDEIALERSTLYADLYCSEFVKQGYPLWTVRIDEKPWEPEIWGSFHSGSAFYLMRLYKITGEKRYFDTAIMILDFYNRNHIDDEGNITVAINKDLKQIKSYEEYPDYSIKGWEVMHEYNDDFGALANLLAYKITGGEQYLLKAKCFLEKMLRIHRSDGGFGPQDYSVPSAAGAVLIELMLYEKLTEPLSDENQKEGIVNYLLNLQFSDDIAKVAGGFRGVDETYNVSELSNARTTAYSIMGLLRYAEVSDNYYFLEN